MPSVHLVKAVQRVMKTLPAPAKPSSAQPTTKATPYDIWNAPSNNTNVEDDEYVDKQTLEARRRKPPTVARRHPNKAAVPLVAKPLAGQSYHPAADEHQAALRKVKMRVRDGKG